MDKTEFYVLIKHFFLNGKNTVEANSWFDSEFPNTAPGISTIKDWYAKYRRSEMSTEDGERSGLPKEVVTEENIADTLKISTEHVHYIIYKYLVIDENI
ncbi:hypothetical protein GWI33_005786 [Rhynchophorus ferrugineus]|uniref:Mos1 transposase HTH domain-containing protein n=1 Tax=Rhynchophorus ferrugineus TaxID=354439 RepID=A0A834MKC1_RHYFE|nr:hypothetical protein GWI33_005786 [Rhynchophorus ferrugineus]